jgi:hypothetical protein
MDLPDLVSMRVVDALRQYWHYKINSKNTSQAVMSDRKVAQSKRNKHPIKKKGTAPLPFSHLP